MKSSTLSTKTTTRQAILEAVVTCIEKHGLESVTTRKIAIEAGTNIASINYHFRSKDQLIAEAFSMTIKHMVEDVFAAIDDVSEGFEETLEKVLFYLLDGSLRFPGISRAHLNEAIREEGRETVSGRAMEKVFAGLAARAASAYPAKNQQTVRLRISQVLYAVMFTILRPDFFPVAGKYRLTSSKHAKELAGSYTRIVPRNDLGCEPGPARGPELTGRAAGRLAADSPGPAC